MKQHSSCRIPLQKWSWCERTLALFLSLSMAAAAAPAAPSTSRRRRRRSEQVGRQASRKNYSAARPQAGGGGREDGNQSNKVLPCLAEGERGTEGGSGGGGNGKKDLWASPLRAAHSTPHTAFFYAVPKAGWAAHKSPMILS